MCGIVGQLGGKIDALILRKMGDQMRLRGPDGHGEWTDTDVGIGLAHRRLAIVDLSPAGAQPMTSQSGRFVICLNGEIYNHIAMRQWVEAACFEYKGKWRGHSDTETFLAAVEHFGIDKALEEARGMFALALWDRADQSLVLARDRFGEKPLYYGWADKAFLFASDLAAIKAHPDFQGEVCPMATAAYLQTNYVPAPYSIYKSFFKLEPGHLLKISAEGAARPNSIPFSSVNRPIGGDYRSYWTLSEEMSQGIDQQFSDETDALEQLEAKLTETLRLQSMADVPVGAFLSGGIDSSLIVALLRRNVGIRPKTYTIGFAEAEFDEADHAQAVAKHLDTDHHELRIGATDIIDLIPRLSEVYSEPFADSSQLPTYFVSKLARTSVTVALSGDAGDELFSGYNRYKWTNDTWPKIQRIPFVFRNFAGHALNLPPDGFWTAVSQIPGPLNVPILGVKAHKIAKILKGGRDIQTLYATLLDEWDGHIKGSAPLAFSNIRTDSRLTDPAKMMLWDSGTYLPDDILCKVDRAAMANSLETRVPFLDHHVAAIAARLPPSMRIRNGETKWALRQLLYRHVPRELIDRPKAGFGIPLGSWLRGPLRDWAESLLSDSGLIDHDLLDHKMIQSRWAEHLAGKRDWSHSLWSVLMLQAHRDHIKGQAVF
jgi:asparagine synthase (glutamine-hydrolysing)